MDRTWIGMAIMAYDLKRYTWNIPNAIFVISMSYLFFKKDIFRYIWYILL